MPERRQPWVTQNNQTQNYELQQTRRVRHKKQEVAESDQTDERINACRVLIVNNKTNNFMGRDLLSKLGITLNATKIAGTKINLISQLQTEICIRQWVFQKFPHLCTRLGRSKNHIAMSIFTKEYTSSQRKGRRVP